MNGKIVALAAMSAATLVGTGARAETAGEAKAKKSVAVFEPRAIGVDDHVGLAVAEVMRDSFARIGYTVAGPVEGMCGDAHCAQTKGKEAGVQEAVAISLARLDTRVVVNAQLVDVASGESVFSEHASASSLDDIEAICPRLARALSERTAFADTVQTDTVTMRESFVPRRMQSITTVAFRTYGFAGAGYSETYLYGGELVFNYEVRDWMVEASIGDRGSNNGKSNEFTFDTGAYRYLGSGDVAPFIGGGAGLHGVEGNGAGALWVGGGITVLRTANVHASVNAKANIDFVHGPKDTPPVGALLGFTISVGG